MGRVNLDQLELIKDQGSSCEEEDDRDVMEMAERESVAQPEDEEEADEEEEREEEEEEREVMENMPEEREMDDEEMEGFKEEEEEQEEEVSEEVAGESHPLQGKSNHLFRISLEFDALELADH